MSTPGTAKSFSRSTTADSFSIISDTTASSSAGFQIAANEPVTYFCSLDGAEYGPCDARISYSSLADGEHSFSAYVVDRAGNDSIVVGRTWTVV